MGLVWNNEYVLEKNKEPRKTGYSSTEETKMADNCFQVWHRSVNEFVLFSGRLTVPLPPFISLCSLFLLTHTHTHAHLLIFLLLSPLFFSCYPVSMFTLSSAFSTASFTFLPLNLSFLPLSSILWCSQLFTSLLYSLSPPLLPPFVLFAC